MRARRAALLVVALAPLAGAAHAERRPAARAVVIEGPPGADSLRVATPTLVVYGVDFDPSDFPITYRIQIATRADFTPPLVDTLITGDTVRVSPPRPLPEKQPIFWRAIARTVNGDEVSSPIHGPRPMAGWLQLVSPNSSNGSLLETRRPEFTWSVTPLTDPPGPWRFDVDVISVGSGRRTSLVRGTTDTTFTPLVDLESNTSYRWQVTARLLTGEMTTVSSAGTFVVLDAGTPLTTLLYQNFPNPFPSATSGVTCFWFDLHEAASVRLEIHDLRGHLVRRLFVSDGALDSGRYGRGGAGNPSACAPELEWDGTADDGSVVPAGVYLARFRAGRVETVRRILFRGR